MEKIWVKKELYKWIYEFLNFIVFSGFYFDFSGLNRAIGRSGLNRAIERSGLNRAIGRSGLNRAIRRSGLNRAIGRLKSHGVESASWATIPPITRDLTAEITRSEIRVTSHQFRAIWRLKLHGVKSASRATNFARSDGWNYTEWNPRHEPPISRDPTAEITRSKIRVVGHDPPISHKLIYK